MTDVPCGGCTLCCSSIVFLLPQEGDDIDAYETKRISTPEGDLQALARKSDGRCVYAGENGCTIHHRRPYMCRIFDCRQFARWNPKQKDPITRRGRALMKGKP